MENTKWFKGKMETTLHAAMRAECVMKDCRIEEYLASLVYNDLKDKYNLDRKPQPLAAAE
jgi:hypothetical protein